MSTPVAYGPEQHQVALVSVPVGWSRVWHGDVQADDMYLDGFKLVHDNDVVWRWVNLAYCEASPLWLKEAVMSVITHYCVIRKGSIEIGQPCRLCHCRPHHPKRSLCYRCLDKGL